ncbi:bifunctional DNA-formamidopyrimidine glycosylase/DNA-(apurinic or apyrimidinic site) lyase [Thiococcus pfennigii]|uniref:bifunctional DNA-formamidopyrimidine glycosylase/DNA-(apurinic or apyrimidinic site) lyase n=1 Tax=Thiococcus pfennigii TaxID=1057 RepID=UPI001905D236|nr:bifunctional DNA-formamidopyrimidine glycosylase/DNA-(apurinic or apyrimidinic site) lyase [Thiococcus pfennigii]MBK1700288.1 DNA-formamidopyrimidine glycosylase [Thiococcus pfennigii]
MPELPEVETTRRGLHPYVDGVRVARLLVRERRLRYPIPAATEAAVAGQRIRQLRRRAKYLIFELEQGALLLHLGMSGSLRIVPAEAPPGPHDHLDLCLEGGLAVRLRDPRRFGALVWTAEAPEAHPLLRHLGPEPLDPGFDGAHLHRLARGRRLAVKPFIMDARQVVGVGNIYANESLHLAGIHPGRASGRIGLARYERLAEAIRAVLTDAIAQGGTSLRDFVQEDGRPGYFRVSLHVYGRGGEPCPGCGTQLREERIGQRTSVYCPRCQR